MATPIHADYNLKTLTIPSTGTTYSYLFIPAKEEKRPTLLFLHGFPSTHHDWRHQTAFFSAKGYGVLAPDLLGYGASSHPTDPSAYRAKKMAAEIVAILDAEGLTTVVGIGHDWGSFLLSRLVNCYPGRVEAAVFMSIGYMPPSTGQRFNLDATNAFTKQHLGFEMFGYWRFFEREDAGAVLQEHFDSFYSLLHTADAELWKTHLCPLGALEAWVKADRMCQIGKWMTEEDKAVYVHNDYKTALNWYRAYIQQLNFEDEVDVVTGTPKLELNLHCPVMLIVAAKDPVGFGHQETRDTVDNLRVETCQTGHWVQLEAVEEVNGHLAGFLMGLEERKAERKDGK